MNSNAFPLVLQPCFESSTPLSLIGGVLSTTESPPPSEQNPFSILKNAFFDWYQCALSVCPTELAPMICSYFGCDLRPCRPQSPYQQAQEFFLDDEVFCTLHYGGVNAKCMFRASGFSAIAGSEFIREYYPEHSVSRLDAAVDFDDGPEFFDAMAQWLVDYAKSQPIPLKVGYAGDWSNGTRGRTLYIGSRKSPVYIRLYEKGHQMVAEGHPDADLNWVRFEAEIKPEKLQAKQRMATKTPAEVFGASKLLRAFSEKICGDKYEPFSVCRPYKPKGLESTLRHMAYQYGDAIESLMELNHGSRYQTLSVLLDYIESERSIRSQCREKLKVKRNAPAKNIVLAKSVTVPAHPLPEVVKSLYTPSLISSNPALLRTLIFHFQKPTFSPSSSWLRPPRVL